MRISEQARQDNRARILERAAELFCERGFEATTTRDVAVASGVAAGTLFNYFPTKETLGMTLVAEALAQGADDHRRRCTGDEDLTEDLFLLIASGLRQLRPLRPFLGPVLERSLSPFPRKTVCPEGEAAREAHLAAVANLLGRHGFAPRLDPVVIALYWSLYLGILACWTSDPSPNQEATRALIDYSLRLFAQVICGAEPGGDDGR
ncbi:MAG: TetR/AcrR family transcriptional regulator [Deltaproteobacteria bacterium]|nr:TetR/AcrR family transcriptional regulator [Deltaproteobacteria bacterium]